MKSCFKRGFSLCLAVMLLLGSVWLLPDSAEAVSISPKLTKTKLTVLTGNKKHFSVSGRYIVKVAYSSTKKAVATVSRKGKTAYVKGRKKGSCRIKAVITYKKKKNSRKTYKKTLYCAVNVKKPATSQSAVTPVKPTPEPVKPEPVDPDPPVEITPVDPGQIDPLKPVNPDSFLPEIPLDPAQALSDGFVSQTAEFGVKMMQAACMNKIRNGKNVLISPESILSALLMTCNGADGNTFIQMKELMAGKLDYENYLREFTAFGEQLAASQNVKFHQANSIWVKDDPASILVREDFVRRNEDLFHSSVYTEPFNKETLDKINGWVKKETDDMIPGVLDEMDPDMVLCLINALAFDGKWSVPYEGAQIRKDQKFTSSKGISESGIMMEETISSYLKDQDAIGFTKEYRGGKFAFLAILPNEELGVETYLEHMSGAGLLKFYESRVKGKAITRLPKFSYDDGGSIAQALQAMGMKDAFAEEAADFSKLAVTRNPLYIGDVIHKTHIEVDENGTKAAAVTAVVSKTTSCMPDQTKPVEIYLDRPFIYGIVSTDTGLPVFLGVVNSIR